MSNEELLQKAEINVATNSVGLLTAEQSGKFIELTVAQNELLSKIRVEKNIGTSRDLDIMGVGTRLIHAPTESTAPSDAALIKGVTTSKRTLTPVEIMLPYNVSFRYLEENQAKEDAENTINNLFAYQFGNDLVDMGLNGLGTGGDAFLAITKGFVQLLSEDANKQLFTRGESTDYKGTIFPGMINALPTKYKVRKQELVFLTSFAAEQKYREQLAERSTALGDAYLTEGRGTMFQGIPVYPVPSMPDNTCLLTSFNNLAIGFGREMSRTKEMDGRARIWKYTITAKVAFNYVLTDKVVYCV